MAIKPKFLASMGYHFTSFYRASFFRLLYAIVKIAFVTAKIIASLDEFTLFGRVDLSALIMMWNFTARQR